MQSLGELLKAQIIDAETYIRLYPDNIMPNKQEILDYITNQNRMNIQQLQQQLTSAAEQIKKFEIIRKNYPSLVEQFNRLDDKFAALHGEYTAKVNEANTLLTQEDAGRRRNAAIAGAILEAAANKKLSNG